MIVSPANSITRRAWLRHAGLGVLFPGWLEGRSAASSGANASPGFGKAKSVLLLYASGGQSHLDMWDPKPNAPVEVRGEFGTIATKVPGIRMGEHMPRIARIADRYTLLRSVSHDDLDHGSATYYALTGHPHARKSSNPPPRPTDEPTFGSIVMRLRPGGKLPYAAVHLNAPALVPEDNAPGQFAGFLGRGYEPLIVGEPGADALPGLEPFPELTPGRQHGRRLLQERLQGNQGGPLDRMAREMDTTYQRAYEVLNSPRVRPAFDLSREPQNLRERYGLYRQGQACLLARRLLEAQVPWVTVVLNRSNRGQDKAPHATEAYGWDTHNDIFEALRDHLLPRFDQTFSTLILDLEERGLLESTLVVCMGEFGRAPRVALEKRFAGATPGRQHWASVYSIVLAGAGVMRGGVVGASDRIGAYPSLLPVNPADVAATMFAALGIDPASHYTDLAGRPYTISPGKPIAALYG